MARPSVPSARVRACNAAPVRPDRRFVLYWMLAYRRRRSNFALEHAANVAERLRRPLVVLEALRVDHPFASDRLHRFVIDGMAANRRDFARAPVLYHPWIERAGGEGRELIATLARDACLVVTDDYPCFFLPRAVAAAAGRADVRFEAVDGNGLLPIQAAGKVFARAFDFRRFLQRELPAHLLLRRELAARRSPCRRRWTNGRVRTKLSPLWRRSTCTRPRPTSRGSWTGRRKARSS